MIRTASSRRALAMALVIGGGATTTWSQVRLVLADRDSDRLWVLLDRDANGAIDASEIGSLYDGSNVGGFPGPQNPNMIGVARDGRVYVGDQDAGARHWLVLGDGNRDGDALDEGEAAFAVTGLNASGMSFAAPSGFGQDQLGRVHFVNAGNGFGPDQIFRVLDGNGDEDYEDDGEVIGVVTINGFGGNGSYGPQEIVFGSTGDLFLRNASANLQGIFRLSDLDASGLIDRSDEFTLFWGVGNDGGVAPTAGFALEIDPMRERAFYTLQIATGGNDQLVRVQDVNGDGDAQDAGESAVVFATAETGFNGVDVLALPDGIVLVSET